MGRPPKPEGEAITRHPRIHDLGTLQWDGVTRGPELPSEYTWCLRTQEWWQTWRDSPQAMLMTPTDWEFMLETALLHNEMWGTRMRVNQRTGAFLEMGAEPNERKSLAGEIRIRLEKLGATVKDRSTMGMKIRTGEADVVREAENVVKSGVDYKKMLG